MPTRSLRRNEFHGESSGMLLLNMANSNSAPPSTDPHIAAKAARVTWARARVPEPVGGFVSCFRGLTIRRRIGGADRWNKAELISGTSRFSGDRAMSDDREFARPQGIAWKATVPPVAGETSVVVRFDLDSQSEFLAIINLIEMHLIDSSIC